MKNNAAKTRPSDKPYERWTGKPGGPREGWTWHVLKKWQTDDNKDFARWHCLVTTPQNPRGDQGDVYVKEIVRNATMTYRDPTYVPTGVQPDPDRLAEQGGDDTLLKKLFGE
jgi:hypothetical protein